METPHATTLFSNELFTVQPNPSFREKTQLIFFYKFPLSLRRFLWAAAETGDQSLRFSETGLRFHQKEEIGDFSPICLMPSPTLTDASFTLLFVSRRPK